jgi:hypothetical protein
LAKWRQQKALLDSRLRRDFPAAPVAFRTAIFHLIAPRSDDEVCPVKQGKRDSNQTSNVSSLPSPNASLDKHFRAVPGI